MSSGDGTRPSGSRCPALAGNRRMTDSREAIELCPGPRRRGSRRPPGRGRAARSAATGSRPQRSHRLPMPAIWPGTATASGPWTLALPATEQSYSSSLVPCGPACDGTDLVHAVVGRGRGPGVGVEGPHAAAGALQGHGGHQVAADPVLVGMAHGAGQAGRGRRVEGVAALAEDPLAGPGDQPGLGGHDAAGPDHGVRSPLVGCPADPVTALHASPPSCLQQQNARRAPGPAARPKVDPPVPQPLPGRGRRTGSAALRANPGATDRGHPGNQIRRALRGPGQASSPSGRCAHCRARRFASPLPMSDSLGGPPVDPASK